MTPKSGLIFVETAVGIISAGKKETDALIDGISGPDAIVIIAMNYE